MVFIFIDMYSISISPVLDILTKAQAHLLSSLYPFGSLLVSPSQARFPRSLTPFCILLTMYVLQQELRKLNFKSRIKNENIKLHYLCFIEQIDCHQDQIVLAVNK